MLRSMIAASVLVFIAAPAAAANYSAKVADSTSPRVIAQDIIWSCAAGACQGSTLESRPIVLCQSLAKRAGKVDGFLVDGRAFTSAELDRCNASAKRVRHESIAAQ